MSSNNKRKLSDKEAQILAAQRRVAAKLTKSSTASKAPPPPPSNKQAALVQNKNQRDQVKKLLKRPSSTKPTVTAATLAAAQQKRPTRNKGGPKSAGAALEAARRRAGGVVDLTKPQKPPPPATGATPNIQRKKTMLGSLISASVSTSSSAPPMETGSYGQVEPEDFWRNMRDWDFVTHYCRSSSNQQQKRKPKKDDNDDDDATAILRQKKPLPDRFINHRHYIASWAPLCLAEARAQMLSEAMSNYKNVFLPVLIETNKKNMGSTLDCLVVIVKPRFRGGGQRDKEKFYPNDSCLLVPEKHAEAVKAVFKSNQNAAAADQSWRKYALLGHTEFMRNSIDGLQLKVSKKWWATVSDSSSDLWVLLKIGCNITALREFTALCRMETIPLKRSLLGQDLEEGSAKLENSQRSSTKAELLNKMGGVSKLGKGFAMYAQKKFNASQMQAIASSAADYGDGGFTLIKGPPGTGKKWLRYLEVECYSEKSCLTPDD